MNLSFTIEPLFCGWSVQQILNKYTNWFIENHPQHNVEIIDTSKLLKSNPSGIYSPHLLTIRNTENKKYMVVSYWDKAMELTWEGNGWDFENCVDIVTSSGVNPHVTATPGSYSTYSLELQNQANEIRKPFSQKQDNELLFRGYLYNERLGMSKLSPSSITNEKIPSDEYLIELNNGRFGFSLNGAAEICNRDIEILSVGTVLFRPILYQKFHNPLIPDYHYIGFEVANDYETQWKIIVDKFNEVRNNYEFLERVANNGLQWYYENGTIDSNVEILKKVINIDKLN